MWRHLRRVDRICLTAGGRNETIAKKKKNRDAARTGGVAAAAGELLLLLNDNEARAAVGGEIGGRCCGRGCDDEGVAEEAFDATEAAEGELSCDTTEEVSLTEELPDKSWRRKRGFKFLVMKG